MQKQFTNENGEFKVGDLVAFPVTGRAHKMLTGTIKSIEGDQVKINVTGWSHKIRTKNSDSVFLPKSRAQV